MTDTPLTVCGWPDRWLPEQKRKPRIIAEIGLHHGGSVERASQMMAWASTYGATDVKFQYFTALDFADRPKGTGWDVLRPYSLGAEHINELRVYSNCCGLKFGCSFFGIDGVRTFRKHGGQLDWAKIPAPYATRDDVTEAVRGLGVPVVRSCYHTATFARVVSGDTLMHCTSGYPTPDDELHLDRIARLPAAPELRGWSCHATPRNVELTKIALRAQAYGAGVFELHFRDHEVPPDSPDYGVSVWPELLREVADALESGK